MIRKITLFILIILVSLGRSSAIYDKSAGDLKIAATCDNVYDKFSKQLRVFCVPENHTFSKNLERLSIICIPENHTYEKWLNQLRVLCLPPNHVFSKDLRNMPIICIPPDSKYCKEIGYFNITKTCPPVKANVKIIGYRIIPLVGPESDIQKFKMVVLLNSNATCNALLKFKNYLSPVHLYANRTISIEFTFNETKTIKTLSLIAEYTLDPNQTDNSKSITIDTKTILDANESYEFSTFSGKIIATVPFKGTDVWSWIEIEENEKARDMSIEKIVRNDGKVIEKWFRRDGKVYIFDDPATYTIYYKKPNLPVVAYEVNILFAVFVFLIIGFLTVIRRSIRYISF